MVSKAHNRGTRNKQNVCVKQASRTNDAKLQRGVLILLLLFVFLVPYHLWWISPTLEALGGRLSPDITTPSTGLLSGRNYVYVGTGRWRNRGLNLVTCLRSMLGDESVHGESVEFTVRRLQLQFLKNKEKSSYDYTRELRGALYPTSDLVARLNGSSSVDDGYDAFVSQSLPFIDAWAELNSLLESLKDKQDSRREEFVSKAAKAKKGDAGAAAELAGELMKQLTNERRGTLVTKPSPLQAASLDGPSIVVLQEGSNNHRDYVPPGSVAGFELRKRVETDDNSTTDLPAVKLAFYKQNFQMAGESGGTVVVVVVRPGPGATVGCIVAGEETGRSRNMRGVAGMANFYECESQHYEINGDAPEDAGSEKRARGMWAFGSEKIEAPESGGTQRLLPVAGLLFGSDFVGGCNAASRLLDAFGFPVSTESKRHKDDVLWSQEMQNVFSSVSAAMRKQLYVASFDISSGQEGTIKVRCSTVASFWTSEEEEERDSLGGSCDGGLQLWQAYRDASASGVGLDWQGSQCLVRLPTRHFPEAKVTNQSVVGSPISLEKPNLHLRILAGIKPQSLNICYGSTGSACTVSIDASTECELTCEHSGSYAVSRGVRSASGRHHPPACFYLERKLETPLVRHNSTALSGSWLTQEEADPVRWTIPERGDFHINEGEEPHSVTLVFTSDVHGRFFRECGSSYCYPGAPHIASVIQTIRSAVSRSGRVGTAVLIDAGDATFGSQYNETLVGMTMNRLGYEAMALGNHEFDTGLRLDAFSDLVNFPIVSTNVDGVPFATDFVSVSLKGGAVLCLLGVSTNEYNPLAGRNVTFADESTVVEMAQNLRTQHGCNHTALLSHAGIEADKRFANESKAKFDAIIGGHSHVLMGVHSTDHMPESSEFGAVSDMNFPFQSDKNPPVAHTGANGRYLGVLRLYWVGTRLEFSQGSLIPLDASHGVFPDNEFELWQSKLLQKERLQEQAEVTEVEIDNSLARNNVCGQSCRTQECLMGNLATDAMLSCVAHGPCSKYAAKEKIVATFALLESGTLRACISSGREDFSEILPWPNNLVLLTMTGATVRKMLEHGVKDMKEGQGGAFLQASGLRYLYRDTHVEDVYISKPNIRRPSHRRRRRVTFSARNRYGTEICAISGAEPSHGASLRDNELYQVVVTDWLASGGDGYGGIVASAEAVTTNATLRKAILEHAKSFPTVSAEDRSQSADAKLTSFAKQGLSGFIGGALSFLLTYPLYTLFVQRSASKKISLGFRDLFAGSMLGILATALSQSIYFAVYSSPELAEYSAFTRSTVAAITNSVATTPLWVLATRKQIKEGSMSAFVVAKHVYNEAGFAGFFTGITMNLVMCIFPVVRQVRVARWLWWS